MRQIRTSKVLTRKQIESRIFCWMFRCAISRVSVKGRRWSWYARLWHVQLKRPLLAHTPRIDLDNRLVYESGMDLDNRLASEIMFMLKQAAFRQTKSEVISGVDWCDYSIWEWEATCKFLSSRLLNFSRETCTDLSIGIDWVLQHWVFLSFFRFNSCSIHSFTQCCHAVVCGVVPYFFCCWKFVWHPRCCGISTFACFTVISGSGYTKSTSHRCLTCSTGSEKWSCWTNSQTSSCSTNSKSTSSEHTWCSV